LDPPLITGFIIVGFVLAESFGKVFASRKEESESKKTVGLDDLILDLVRQLLELGITFEDFFHPLQLSGKNSLKVLL
jgi:hypothetical protein